MDCLPQPLSYPFRHPHIRARHENPLYYMGLPMESFWGDSKHRNGTESRLVVIGHRGCGKNLKPGSATQSRPSTMENTITSFNTAAQYGADFVEFDVQVTKDGFPIVFHDDCIVVAEQEGIVSKRIVELTLEEFLSIGYQRNSMKERKVLLRESVDGSFAAWTASIEDCLCTLEDVFEEVVPSIGFNIELKFHDTEIVDETEIRRTIDATLKVVDRRVGSRKVYFSSFHPDAAQILRKKQSAYPVFFLTDGGVNLYVDPRRNSLDAAIQVCQEGGLQGIVSEVKAILQNPESVSRMQDAGLCVLTYGGMNNMAEAVRKQEEWGVDGVIVDDVQEMVADIIHRRPKRLVEMNDFSAQDASNRSPASTPLLRRAIPA